MGDMSGQKRLVSGYQSSNRAVPDNLPGVNGGEINTNENGSGTDEGMCLFYGHKTSPQNGALMPSNQILLQTSFPCKFLVLSTAT